MISVVVLLVTLLQHASHTAPMPPGKKHTAVLIGWPMKKGCVVNVTLCY